MPSLHPRTAPSHTFRLAAAGVVAALLVAGCGGGSGDDDSPVSALLSELAAAGPQGQVTPLEAADAADRQQKIVRSYLGKVEDGRCRESLRQLASRYSLFEQFARALDAGGDADAYARAAGTVATGVDAATAACGEAAG